MKELFKVENLFESIYEEGTNTLDLHFETSDLNIWMKHVKINEKMDEFFLDSQSILDRLLEDIEDNQVEINIKIDLKELENVQAQDDRLEEVTNHLNEVSFNKGYSNAMDSMFHLAINDVKSMALDVHNNEAYIYTKNEWFQYICENILEHPQEYKEWLIMWKEFSDSGYLVVIDQVKNATQEWI